MKNWMEAGKNWRCCSCLNLLEYLEIWQNPQTGEAFCVECWTEFHLMGFPQLPAIVCDECAVPMLSSITKSTTGQWTGTGLNSPQLCESCSEPLSEGEVDEALSGLLQLLEDTHEER